MISPRGIDAPKPVRVALNRPAPEEENLFAEWLAETDGAPERPERRDLVAATGLAERLASPTVKMTAVAEVSQ